jgi:hypothetical protein
MKPSGAHPAASVSLGNLRRKMLFGFRGLFNNDLERRTDSAGTRQGLARSAEYRLGGSVSLWEGGWFDAGATRLERRNALSAAHTVTYHPNLGFEQTLLQGRLTPRFGLDETSPTAGLSYRFIPFRLDFAYVNNMAKSRVHDLFGQTSNRFPIYSYDRLPWQTPAIFCSNVEMTSCTALISCFSH